MIFYESKSVSMITYYELNICLPDNLQLKIYLHGHLIVKYLYMITYMLNICLHDHLRVEICHLDHLGLKYLSPGWLTSKVSPWSLKSQTSVSIITYKSNICLHGQLRVKYPSLCSLTSQIYATLVAYKSNICPHDHYESKICLYYHLWFKIRLPGH